MSVSRVSDVCRGDLGALAGEQPGVDRESRAGHEAGAVGGQKKDGLGDVLGFDPGDRQQIAGGAIGDLLGVGQRGAMSVDRAASCCCAAGTSELSRPPAD
jgi:hypothetical protein